MSNREEKKHKCVHCARTTSTRSALNNHLKIHCLEKPYKCDQCTYACAAKFNLITHQKRHAGEKQYKCDQCGYASVSSSTLARHKLKHTGEKPYKCDQCLYACATKFDLITHQRRHEAEKPYKCDQCGYTSVSSGGLGRHKIKHTGAKQYKCDQCTFACAVKFTLITHQRTHTGEKPYKCDQCCYASAYSACLAHHKLKHTMDKLYNCHHCNFSTAHQEQLTDHIAEHTGENTSNIKGHNFTYTTKTSHKYDQCQMATTFKEHALTCTMRRMEVKPCLVVLCRLTNDQISRFSRKRKGTAVLDAVDLYNHNTFEQPYINKAMFLGTEWLEIDTSIIKEEPTHFMDHVPKINLIKQEVLKCDGATDPDAIDLNNQDTFVHPYINTTMVVGSELLEIDISNIKVKPVDFVDKVSNTDIIKQEDLKCDDASDPDAVDLNNQDTFEHPYINENMVLDTECLEIDTSITKVEPVDFVVKVPNYCIL